MYGFSRRTSNWFAPRRSRCLARDVTSMVINHGRATTGIQLQPASRWLFAAVRPWDDEKPVGIGWEKLQRRVLLQVETAAAAAVLPTSRNKPTTFLNHAELTNASESAGARWNSQVVVLHTQGLLRRCINAVLTVLGAKSGDQTSNEMPVTLLNQETCVLPCTLRK